MVCVVRSCCATSPYREVCMARGGIGSGETLCHDIYPARPITTVFRATNTYWMMDGHSSCAPCTVGSRVQFSGACEHSHWWQARHTTCQIMAWPSGSPPAVCLAGHQRLCSHAPLNWTLGPTVQGAHELSVICYQWFKQRLILSVSKPSISQRSQIKDDTVEPSVPALEFNLKAYATVTWHNDRANLGLEPRLADHRSQATRTATLPTAPPGQAGTTLVINTIHYMLCCAVLYCTVLYYIICVDVHLLFLSNSVFCFNFFSLSFF